MIRSLERGGAERQLIELARGLANDGHEVTVATLYAGGAMRSELDGVQNLAVRSFQKSARWDMRFLLQLARDVCTARPHIVHGYMSPANELAVILAKISGAKSVVGLRASDMDFSQYDRLARQLFRTGAAASHVADAVVVNSQAGRDHYIRRGYAASRMVVIPNGVDCVRFTPDVDARRDLRAKWNVADDELLFGLVGRLDPMKDHATFIRALAAMKPADNVRFVCVGAGDERLRASLAQLAGELQVDRHILWTGARDDMPKVYNALDVLVLCSAFGEGFPNVVAEAMATERPCVVTDVGDARHVVATTGLVVARKDPAALAAAMNVFAHAGHDELARRGALARQRIVANFSNRQLVSSTSALLESLARGRTHHSMMMIAEPNTSPRVRRPCGSNPNPQDS
jgi:glycosyltransferase involved in cell wall biosynthesis